MKKILLMLILLTIATDVFSQEIFVSYLKPILLKDEKILFKKRDPTQEPLRVFKITESKVTDSRSVDTGFILNNSERKFTLTFEFTPLADAVKVLSKESGLNIVLPEDMQDTANVSLKDVTLKNALEILLLSYGYNYKIEGNVVRVYKEN
jgi:type II secretory pathway component HofQ